MFGAAKDVPAAPCCWQVAAPVWSSAPESSERQALSWPSDRIVGTTRDLLAGLPRKAGPSDV